jgi:atypical dual specificity phosphatase
MFGYYSSAYDVYTRPSAYFMQDDSDQCTSQPHNYISQITDNIFISDVDSAENIELLRKFNITHVLSLIHYNNIMVGIYDDANIEYKRIPIFDSPDELILDKFPAMIEFIANEQHGVRVLVHCECGISRSVTAVAAYLLKVFPDKYKTVEDVLNFIRSKRIVANPNYGFVHQLKNFIGED